MEEGEGKEDEDVEDHAINPARKPVEKNRAETLVIRWTRKRGRWQRMWKTAPSTPSRNLSQKKKTASEMLVIVGKGEEEEDQVEEEEEEEVALAQVGRQCQ